MARGNIFTKSKLANLCNCGNLPKFPPLKLPTRHRIHIRYLFLVKGIKESISKRHGKIKVKRKLLSINDTPTFSSSLPVQLVEPAHKGL